MAAVCERDGCNAVLPIAGRGRIPRFCSGRCRVAAHRARKAEQVPAELRECDRWIRRSEDKVPLTADGAAASSTDPDTWSSHDRARRSRAGVGLGFVLAAEDDIVCIDLDHALTDDGTPTDWAAAILERTPPTWIEVSPSGDGLHIWGRADWLGGRRLPQPGGGIEVYGSSRYITVTGQRYGQAPAQLGQLDDLIRALV